MQVEDYGFGELVPQGTEPAPAAPAAGQGADYGFGDLVPGAPAPSSGAPARITVRPERPYVPQGPQLPDMGAPAAAAVGALNGASANFADELLGLFSASGAGMDSPQQVLKAVQAVAAPAPALLEGAAKLGYEALTGEPGEWTKAYEAARDRWRQISAQAETQHPVANAAASFGGAMAVPASRAVSGASFAVRSRQGAKAGALVGGLSGLGEGQTTGDRAVRAATGAGLGLGIGGVAPLATELALRGARAVARPVANAVRRFTNPDAAAARTVAAEVHAAQTGSGRGGVVPQGDMAALQARGQPVMNIDIAGPGGRRAARAARNTPGASEGQAALEEGLQERFHQQSARIGDFIDRLTAGRVSLDRILEQARGQNRPAYQRAYTVANALVRRDADAFWTRELQTISRMPSVQHIMETIGTREGDRSILAGNAYPRRNPWVRNPGTGFLQPRLFNSGHRAVPDLQVWDSVQRILRSQQAQAVASGDREGARHLTQIRQRLMRELDRIVPEFQQARGTAFRGFRAEDAFEAGENYVTMKPSGREARALRQVIDNMSGRDRVVFMHGFASKLIGDVRNIPDNVDVVGRIFNSPLARAKVVEALGARRAGELEAFLHVERIMNYSRRAVMGNSTTAAQIADATAAGAITGAGFGYLTGDGWTAALTGVAGAGGRHVQRRAGARIADRVGEMFASDNPDVFARGVAIAARSEQIMQRLRTIDSRLGRGAAPQTTVVVGPAAGNVARTENQPDQVPGPPQK